MIVIECPFEPSHTHEYPDDWIMGGASSLDPRADERWHPTLYEYYNDRAERIYLTQVPLCDDEALEYCTTIASWGRDWNPVWIAAVRPDKGAEMLPFIYNKTDDTLYPKESGDG